MHIFMTVPFIPKAGKVEKRRSQVSAQGVPNDPRGIKEKSTLLKQRMPLASLNGSACHAQCSF
jgi:hypothetical protein